jgi:RNA polymerase sigma factor (sigma-70 family)
MLHAPQDPADRNATIVWLFHRYRADVLRFLASRSRSRRELDDHCQEVFLRVIALKDLSQIEDFKNYLFQVAASVLAGAHEKKNKTAVIEDSEQANAASEIPREHDPLFDPHASAEGIDLKIDLNVVSAGLSRVDRELIVLKLRGEENEAIAKLQSTSIFKVKRRLQEAYAHMRNQFSGGKGKATHDNR